MKTRCTGWLLFAAALCLASATRAEESARITEFMAANANGLRDENGDASDWIEIYNPGAGAVSLEGWYLTDTPTNLPRWRFPATNLAANSYLVVFASGMNRALPGANLHTSFKLNPAGGFLALVKPDTVTVASRFFYGEQFPDLSFGLGLGPTRSLDSLVGAGAPLKYLIPEATVDEAWRGAGVFNDSSWIDGKLSAGFSLNIGAVTIAYSVPTNTPGNQAFNGSLGMDFDVAQPVQVTELGCFDDSGNGIAAGTTITVQIWRRNNKGTPTVPTDDTGLGVIAKTNFTAVAPGTLSGGQRFKALPLPVTLTNGSYTIVAYGYGANERDANLVAGVSVVTPNSGEGVLRFVGRSRYGAAGAFPDVPDSQVAGYGAGTFKFAALPATNFGTLLTAMHDTNATVLLRVPFAIPADASYSALSLTVAYDDGFAAFLNGTEVARRNAPDSLVWNATSTAEASASVSIDLTTFSDVVRPGPNILAIHGLNFSPGDGDFRLDAGLAGERRATNQVYFDAPTPGRANTAGLLFPRVVINEIHSDPPNSKSFPAGFIELYNPLASPVDVSGWSFTHGISYQFPAATSISAHGYLVVAEAPALILQRFGVVAFGPWIGGLANDGETIQLVDAMGAEVDSVSYELGFPWPTVGDDPERSMQLVHEGLDNNLGGSWRSAPPTPGARNLVTSDNVPPQVRQVQHDPPEPASGQIVTITARVTDPDGVQAVTLDYQVVEPGNYLRLTDPAFTNNWTSMAMRDDGAAGDALANDSVFTAQIPAGVQRHRRLIRYRIHAGDARGSSVRVPYADDPAPNFAYFVYDGVPAWTAAVRPGVTPAETFGTNTMRKVRPYHLLSRAQDVQDCQYNAAYNDNIFRFEGAMVVDGRVYDHIHYHVRGQNSTYNTGKNKWKLQFNRGHWFEMPDDYGATHTTVETLNWSGLGEPWAPWNRGLAGLDEAMQYRLSNLAGAPAPRTSYFQLRVIDQAAEASPSNQYEGDLWGLYLAFENQDNRFKAAHGLPDGNIFRMQVTAGNNHLLGQGAGQPADLSDLNAFTSPTTGYNKSPTQPEAWWRAHVDLEKYFSWRAVDEAVNNTDIRDQENVVYFRDPLTGLWHIEPWDCDLLYEQLDRWGPEATQDNSPYEQIRRCLLVTNIGVEFKNRARELQDLLLNSDQVWKLVDEYVSLITDGGAANPGFVEADRRRWDYNPINPAPPRGVGPFGNFYKTPYPVPNMGLGPPQPFFRVLASPDFAGEVDWVKNFLVVDPHGGARLASLANDATIPDTPVVAYVGLPDYPADGLVFAATSFSSPAGRAFAGIEWRMGEVYYPGVPNYSEGARYRYEVEQVWNSGELASFNSQIAPPAEYLQEGHTYRLRVKIKDSGGRWSHWSAPDEFTVSTRGVSRLARDLIVTEIMYHPLADGAISGDEFEFLELKNSGTNDLNVGGLAFTEGISFSFANGTILAPGQFFVLARNLAQFAGRYPGVTVGGVFSGKLDNGGETIRLSHPLGGTVFALSYHDAAPWPVTPDGFGFSLVPLNPHADPDPNSAWHWRATSSLGGSPGADDPANRLPPVLVNEVLSQSDGSRDFIELWNPTDAAADISGWFLTDDPAVPKKFHFPANTLLAARSYAAFDERSFNASPGTADSFALSGAGDDVYLFSGDASGNLTGYSHGVRIGAAATGVSFGRYVNSVGEEQFPAQVTSTLGAANAGPRVGPVVMSEIHYHPGLDDEEFIELRNVTPSDVPLFDPANPTNTWRINGLGYSFPTNVVLPGNAFLLIVATDPAVFRAKYAVPGEVLVFGPMSGALQDSGERLELQRPDASGVQGIPYITVDEVRYNDKAPWPPGADGGGPSLQRRAALAYGNDPINWEAARPTPGKDFIPGQPPSIVTQPQSQTIVAYQDAVFSLTALGPEPIYVRWLFNGEPLASGTSATLLLTNVQPAQAGFYHAVVYNSAGSVTSARAQLTTLLPAMILKQPQNISTNAGRTVTFSVQAIGSGALRYQWRLEGVDLLNQTKASLTMTNIQSANAGFYSVKVTDAIGSVTSVSVRLAVLFDPAIVESPLSQEVVTGGTVTLSVSVTNTATLPIGYRWRRNGQSLAGATFVLNERICFLAITNTQLPYNSYSVTVTNAAKPAGLNSASAILTFLADSDGDGLPDAWEEAHGLSSTDALDRALDSDGDGMLNWQEYVAGTDPTDALSYLKIDSFSGAEPVSLRFGAISNKTYTVQFTDQLGSAGWRKLADVPAHQTNHTELIVDAGVKTNRFYRVLTPRQP